jgi:hypothetical protein
MPGNSNLDQLCRPDRFAEVARLHQNAFAWKRQGRIPLGIHVANPEYAKDLDYSKWLDPEPYLEFQTRMLADTLTVGSDLMPAVAINHLGDVVIPSMFGAKLLMPKSGSETYQEAGATLQNVGPTPYPVLSDIQEVAELKMPSLDAGIVPGVEKIIRFYRENLPPWVHVVAPMPIGPFSTAMELRGSEILIDLVDHPGLCRRLLSMCEHLQVGVDQKLRGLAGTSLDKFITNFSIHTVGLRLGDDSIVNLSPAMIHQFCLPAYGSVNQSYGGRDHIHFCSLAHSRFEHIYEALAPASEVTVVSSQFGFEYYEQHVDELRDCLAIESFYGDAYKYVCQKYGSFRDWANYFVPRFKNESGLVLYCQVDSLEEGHEVWAAWQEAHQS